MSSNWRHAQKLPDKASSALQPGGAERTNELERANQDLKAEQAELQKRWQYLAEAQKLSHSGTFGWKVSTGELIWSEETYRVLGFTRETNPTLDLVFDRIHPEDRERLQQLRDRAAQNGMDLDVEYRILLLDGVLRYLHVVAHAGEDRSGNREYIGVVSDITERKLAEQERQALARDLKESNARLEEAQRVAHVGYWEWDLETGEVIWSDETYRIFGLRPQERPMNLEMVRQMVHPEDRDALYSGVDVELDAGVHPVAEFRIVTPSGEVRTVHAITSKLWGVMPGDPASEPSGKARWLFGTVQDVTETKRAEEAHHALARDLQESKTWLEEAQRVAHLGYWVWDLQTNQVIWSEETYRIFGLTPQVGSMDIAIVGEMFHPDDREVVFRTAEEAIRSGTRADCEHRLIRPDGEIRVVHSLGDLKKDSEGRTQMFGTTQDITDRKRADEALQQTQIYLREGQRLAHMGSWAFNDSGLYWSDELYHIFGLDPGNGAPTLEQHLALIHSQDRASMAETIETMFQQHCGCDVTKRIVRADGQLRYVRCVGVPVVEDGVFKGFHGTAIDVTEQELLTQELRREQAYFTDAQRMAHIGSWSYNLITQMPLHSSDENARLYGFDPSQGPISAERFFATLHAEDAPYVNATVERAVREGTDFYLDGYRIHHTDGSIRFLRAIGRPSASGEPGEYVGVTMDITERKRAEEALQRSQFYLSEGQRLAHIGSWATNFDTGQIFHLSDEVFRLHGFDPRQGPVPLERFFDTLHPEDRPAVTTTLENAIRTRMDYDIPEFRICLPDGTIRFLRTIGHHNPSEEIGYYVGITMDITERKRAEEEREKLRQLEADLSHINRVNMLGELATALAHEIKQPIAASITSAGALLRWLAHDPPDLERARAAATRIEQDGNRAADVINRLRSFYKKGPPSGREIVNVKEIIQEMTVLLRDEAIRNSVTIHSELDTDPPNVLADRVQLQQVFMNLMLNAIEAMKDTGGELTITARPNPEGQVIVSISDTGVGLPKESTEQIFDAFYTTKQEGTGMGLAITRSIVESHGGRVWATAHEGAGATFHFTLPIEAEAHA